jgi:hypothetical protein
MDGLELSYSPVGMIVSVGTKSVLHSCLAVKAARKGVEVLPKRKKGPVVVTLLIMCQARMHARPASQRWKRVLYLKLQCKNSLAC